MVKFGYEKRMKGSLKMQDVIFSENGSTLTATPTCEIDQHTPKIISEKKDKALIRTRAERLVLDFSEVRFMDSSGIGLIIGRAEAAGEMGASVRVVGLSPILMKIVRLSGIDKISNLSIG